MVTGHQLTQLGRESLCLCCFHCFQVSLVPKVSQIINTTVSDPFLHVIDIFLLNLYFTEMF